MDTLELNVKAKGKTQTEKRWFLGTQFHKPGGGFVLLARLTKDTCGFVDISSGNLYSFTQFSRRVDVSNFKMFIEGIEVVKFLMAAHLVEV